MMNKEQKETIRRLGALVAVGQTVLIESKLKNRSKDVQAFDKLISGEFYQTAGMLLDLEEFHLYDQMLRLVGCSIRN
jgi:hypothetical protein